MINSTKVLRQGFLLVMVLSFSLLVSGSMTGCASTKTTQHETTVTSTGDDADRMAESKTTQTHTETTTETAKGESTGILGGAFHVIGTILAFPFKLIGSLLEAIF